jgi:acyl-coenzyme A thioesterase PaaI-like protein
MAHKSLAVLDREIQDLSRGAGAGSTFPPNCFLSMKGEFLEYESRTSLTAAFPVLDDSLNPLRKMQGGFITAAFDNTFGPLSYLAARCPCITVDLHTQFIRSVSAGDTLTVTAKVVSRSAGMIYLSATAFDSNGKLVAMCAANMIPAKP